MDWSPNGLDLGCLLCEDAGMDTDDYVGSQSRFRIVTNPDLDDEQVVAVWPDGQRTAFLSRGGLRNMQVGLCRRSLAETPRTLDLIRGPV